MRTQRLAAPRVRAERPPWVLGYERAIALCAEPLPVGMRGQVGRGLRRAVDAAVVPLARVQGVEFADRTTGGWWWTGRWRFEWLTGLNERSSVRWVEAVLRPGDVVVDGGAHLGYYTRRAAARVGATGRVLAVEPHPENAAALRRNTRRLPSVTVVESALGGDVGTVRLFESAGSSNHSVHAAYAAGTESRSVPVTTLDALVATAGVSRVDLVKLDLEGAETAALSGARETLRRHRPVLLVEHAPSALDAAALPRDALLVALEEHGYLAWEVDHDGGLHPPRVSPPQWVNLLCVPAAQRSVTAPRPAAGAGRAGPRPPSGLRTGFGSVAARRDRRRVLRAQERGVPTVLAAAVAALRADRGPDAVLTVLQIGAFDGVTNDPLHRHLVRGRWRGVLVEAVPELADRLRQTYRDFPDLAVDQVVVDEHEGTSTLYRLRDELPGAPAWAQQLGSLRKDVVLWHGKAIPDIADRLVELQLPATTVPALLTRHGLDRIDVVQVDAEGADGRILRQLDLDRLRPQVVLYEHKHLPPDERAAVARRLRAHGYAVLAGSDDSLAVPRRRLPRLTRAW